MTAGLEAGIEVEARLTNDPGWEVDAYLDANLNLEGNLLGRWELDHNLANKRLKAWRIANGLINQAHPTAAPTKPANTPSLPHPHRVRCWQSPLVLTIRAR
jgi:hypothetical protein